MVSLSKPWSSNKNCVKGTLMTNFSHPQQKDQSYCSNYTSTPKLKACFRNESSRHVEKAMAPHSSALAWKVPWTEEPGGLQSTGSLRVGYDWETSLSLFTFMSWRRKWQPTPVFLPGESQGRGSLVCCHLWGRTESDTTEATQQQQLQQQPQQQKVL